MPYKPYEDEFKRVRQAKLQKELLQPNEKNIRIMKLLKDADPKYAKHMFLKNEIIEKFAMHMGGGIDILEQPICPHCERPCSWDKGGSAYCWSCHKSIPADKVVTVRDYLLDQIKDMPLEILEKINAMGDNEDEGIIISRGYD